MTRYWRDAAAITQLIPPKKAFPPNVCDIFEHSTTPEKARKKARSTLVQSGAVTSKRCPNTLSGHSSS